MAKAQTTLWLMFKSLSTDSVRFFPKVQDSESNHSSSPPNGENGTSFASLRAAIDAYEDDANARGIPGVLASRQACLDAHEYGRINDESPLVKRRIVMPLD